jgi:hypothetical protein
LVRKWCDMMWHWWKNIQGEEVMWHDVTLMEKYKGSFVRKWCDTDGKCTEC